MAGDEPRMRQRHEQLGLARETRSGARVGRQLEHAGPARLEIVGEPAGAAAEARSQLETPGQSGSRVEARHGIGQILSLADGAAAGMSPAGAGASPITPISSW